VQQGKQQFVHELVNIKVKDEEGPNRPSLVN
jgi:hypothetical protein